MPAKPRFHTPRNPARKTLGGKAAKVAAALGKPYLPWQRGAADVALEVDSNGRFFYHNVVITVPRQAGKTTMTLSVGLHRTMTTPNGKVWYTAQSGQAARERFLQELAPDVQRHLPGLFDLKRGAGDTRLIMPSINSQYRPHPPTDKYLHGEQSDLNQIDEPWAYTPAQGSALMQALVPTQNTRPNAQTMMLSTMGDAGSTWWHDIVDRARAGDSPRTCIIDYGLDESADASDVDAVIAAHPAVGYTIEPQAILDAYHTMEPAEFARAYGNQRTATRTAVFDSETIAAVVNDARTIGDHSEIVFAAAVAWDRTHAAIAAAGWGDDGTPIAEIVETRPGSNWAVDRLAQLNSEHRPRALIVDAHSPASTIAAAPELEDVITIPTAKQVAAGTASFLDGVKDATITIRPDLGISRAFDVLALRNMGDLGQLFDRKNSAGSIAELEAVSLALMGLTQSHDTGMPTIWTFD